MSVLAIDTSSRRRLVAVRASSTGDLEDGLIGAGRVDTEVPRMLRALIGSALEALVVVVGPGSYTGLRAGMAAGLGVAQPRGLPLHGIGTLDVLSAAVPPSERGAGEVWVAADAGRGGVYAAPLDAATGRIARAPERLTIAALRHATAHAHVASADSLDVPHALAVDPVAALAAAVPRALVSPALRYESLAALVI